MPVFDVKEFFHLSDKFLEVYKGKQPEWGPVGYVTYKRTYARPIEGENRTEEFHETLKRVVEGVYTAQLHHCRTLRLPWNAHKSQKSAQEMYRLMWEFKFLPPGRGLWAMGTDVVWKKGAAALSSCAFISTKDLATDFAHPFTWLMDMSMFGVGVAFDTKGAGTISIKEPKYNDTVHIVDDSKEGWCDLVGRVLESYIGKNSYPAHIDYSLIRPAGAPIKTFGGIAPGPDPLIKCVEDVTMILNRRIGQKITSGDIVDLANIIGRCVVSGGVRRCLPKTTPVYTKNGIVPISRVKAGDKVWTMNGWKSVTEYVDQGWQEIVEIKTNIGSFPCTPQHRMKVFTGLDSFEWKRAEQLRPGDKLVFSAITEPMGKHTTLPLYIREDDEDDTFTLPELDEEMAWFIGYIQNNADTDINHNSTTIKIHKFNGILNSLKKQLARFGVDVESTSKWGEDDSLFVEAAAFTQYIHELITSDRVYRGIPSYIKNATNSIRAAYICGVVDGNIDYHNEESKSYIICYGDNLKFVNSVQTILTSLGVVSRVVRNENDDTYEVRVDGEKHIIALEELLSTHCETAEGRTFPAGSFEYTYPKEWFTSSVAYSALQPAVPEMIAEELFDEIGLDVVTPIDVISVEYFGNCTPTCDISVEDDHEFLCGPGLMSHNTAELALGDWNDKEYLNLKNPELYAEEMSGWRWASNNSVYGVEGMDYSQIVHQIEKSGEPGIVYMDNVRNYGRMKDGKTGIDVFADGVNPCAEMSLSHAETCSLVELFPTKHENLDEFLHTIKYAYLFAKSVSLIPTHSPQTNQVALRNRRFGISLAGIIDAFEKFGRRTFLNWCNAGYERLKHTDLIYSQWLCVPLSIKMTTVKPGGTIPLLPGVSPGIHYPHSKYYIRRIRIQNTSPLIEYLVEAGYECEETKYNDNTMVFSFPVESKNFLRSKRDVSVWEQLENAVDIQHYWSDNNISQTVTFKQEEIKDLKPALEIFESRLKTLSFLPLDDHGYEQAPYEEIDEETFKMMSAKLKPLDLSTVPAYKDLKAEEELKYCTGDTCLLKLETGMGKIVLDK